MPVLNDAARQVVTGGNLAHIVTLNEDGSPNVVCIWTGMDGDDIVSAHLNGNQRKHGSTHEAENRRNRGDDGDKPDDCPVAGCDGDGGNQEKTEERVDGRVGTRADHRKPPSRLMNVQRPCARCELNERKNHEQQEDKVSGDTQTTNDVGLWR